MHCDCKINRNCAQALQIPFSETVQCMRCSEKQGYLEQQLDLLLGSLAQGLQAVVPVLLFIRQSSRVFILT